MTSEKIPLAWTSSGYSLRVEAIALLPRPVRVLLAAAWARKTLPIWENAYPLIDGPRKAIEAAEKAALGIADEYVVVREAASKAFDVAYILNPGLYLFSAALAAAGAAWSVVYNHEAACDAVASVYTYGLYATTNEQERYGFYTLYQRTRGPEGLTFESAWKTTTTTALAKEIITTRQFDLMPILADALQEAGCEHRGVLDHLRRDLDEQTLSDWSLWQLCDLK